MIWRITIILIISICYAATDPNFVFILTDDQDLVLNGMDPLNRTRSLIADQGKTFQNAFANTPVCCPSRSTILTGRYVHNIGVINNSISGNCSSPSWKTYHEPYSISALLKENKDYVTFYAGKYLNRYGYEETGGTKYVPKGYDWWIGLQGNSRYYNYTLSVNGTEVFHANDYFTDLIGDYSLSFLDNRPPGKPFFMTIALPAAHAPFTPAKRHENAFAGLQAVRTPSFNYSAHDKHWLISMLPSPLPDNATIMDKTHQNRQETLLAVDELVASVIDRLKDQGVLDNTYIIFTSDHGFHIGQFSQPWDKRQPYETDIRIPFIIRGPNITGLATENYPMLTVDIAPTILDLAGVEIPDYMDGESLKSVIVNNYNDAFYKEILIEYWGEGDSTTVANECSSKDDGHLMWCSVEQWCKCQDSSNNTYTCSLYLTPDNEYKYCEFDDQDKFIEAYNITSDPFELVNLAKTLKPSELKKHKTRLNKLKTCSGRSCRINNMQPGRYDAYTVHKM